MSTKGRLHFDSQTGLVVVVVVVVVVKQPSFIQSFVYTFISDLLSLSIHSSAAFFPASLGPFTSPSVGKLTAFRRRTRLRVRFITISSISIVWKHSKEDTKSLYRLSGSALYYDGYFKPTINLLHRYFNPSGRSTTLDSGLNDHSAKCPTYRLYFRPAISP